jgi:hypothetical protein
MDPFVSRSEQEHPSMKWHPVSSRRWPALRFCRPRVEELEARRMLSVNVLTYQNDIGRTGANLQETTLTPDNVNANDFGLLTTYPLDGLSFTQPLYMSNLTLPDGSVHNAVFVATEHDSVYAYDANGGGLLWQDSFIDPANDITPVPSDENEGTVLGPEEGITGTPVIDPATGALYVVAMTKEVSDGTPTYVQRLHALDVHTGAELFGGPVEIAASVPGTGDASQDGVVYFDPFIENQRPGLLLSHNRIYVSWASFEDAGNYNGWVIAYNARTLRQVAVFNDDPNGSFGGIWMSGAALAADSQGFIFISVGNGSFDPNQGNFGEDVITLATLHPRQLTVTDYFAPYNWASLDDIDADLGSGGVTLIPNQNDGSPPRLVTIGKEGVLYLLDTTSLGGFNANADQVYQEIRNAAPHGGFSSPAYFNGEVYYIFNFDVPKAFSLAGGYLSTSPVSQGAQVYPYPGATPNISANGDTNGIVWAIRGTEAEDQNAELYAYDATDLSRVLYHSNENGPPDQIGFGIRFQVPTVADGKVFVVTEGGLSVFGLFGDTAALAGPAALGQAPPPLAVRSVPVESGLSTVATIAPGSASVFAGTLDSLSGGPGLSDSSGSAAAVPEQPAPAAGLDMLSTGLDNPVDGE